MVGCRAGKLTHARQVDAVIHPGRAQLEVLLVRQISCTPHPARHASQQRLMLVAALQLQTPKPGSRAHIAKTLADQLKIEACDLCQA